MADRKMTRQEAKKAEAEKFTAYVKSVLAEAHAAATAAAAEFIKSAKRTPDGQVADLCGNGTVFVFKPSYRLRETLKALGEVTRDYDGAWHISNFSSRVGSQSVTAHEKACAASCEVLKRAFPGEGEFFARARIN